MPDANLRKSTDMLQRGSGSGLLLFDPPRDAEPSAQGEAEPADSNGDTADSAKPSVLNKLQKWVGACRMIDCLSMTQQQHRPRIPPLLRS